MPTTCDAPPHTRVEDVCLATTFPPRERRDTHTHRPRPRVVVVVVVVETNANVLSRKETKRGTANPNDQSRTTTTTKDIYPTALSRPYFFLDTINIVSVYPQLIYTSYPIASKSFDHTTTRAHLTLQRKRKRKGIHHARVASRLVFSSPRSSQSLADDDF